MPERAMPSFEPPPQELQQRFNKLLAGYPEAVVRKMFGSPCAFVNGNMATGLFGVDWFVRLDPAAAVELLAVDGAVLFSPMPGRPWADYVVLPVALISDDDRLQPWLEASVAFVASLPRKPAKPPKSATSAKAAKPA